MCGFPKENRKETSALDEVFSSLVSATSWHERERVLVGNRTSMAVAVKMPSGNVGLCEGRDAV